MFKPNKYQNNSNPRPVFEKQGDFLTFPSTGGEK